MKTTYLSLGSNIGNKPDNLQRAVDQIALSVGIVCSVSSCYKSASYGFKGDDFLNICIQLKTELRPQKLLEELQRIELSLGRTRSNSDTYTSRTIDIDILVYEDEVLTSGELVLPHPEMHKRAFVLKLLVEIAPYLFHPIEKKTIKELLSSCKDTTEVVRINKCIKKPVFLSEKYNYIAIEGNIGAGKTTLTNMIADDFNAKKVLERFADNPFLPKFYNNKDRFAFPLEMSFLADRYQQLSDDLAQFDLFKSFTISDYYIFKSLIFAQVTLLRDEYLLYRRIFDIMYNEITKPDLYIYLYQSTDRLLENIKKRGRDYEQNISAEYLKKVHRAYANFIQSEQVLKTLIIDISEYDFVNRPSDYRKILNEMGK